MTTILIAYDSLGKASRCDAKCHEATGFDCACICGGAFHGVGREIAIEDRNTLTDDEIRQTIRKPKARIKRVKTQGTLFGGEMTI